MNTNGTTDLENVCLTVGTNCELTNSTNTWTNVCAEIGNTSQGAFRVNNGATIDMVGTRIKLFSGNILTAVNGAISGNIDAIHLLNGNIENYGTWAAPITDYCVSGTISVPTSHLPANENCSTIDNYFDPCDCNGN